MPDKPRILLPGPRERHEEQQRQKSRRGRKPLGGDVANAVRVLRYELKLSLREIATRVGIAPSTVHNILGCFRNKSESSPPAGEQRLETPILCKCGLLIERLPCTLCRAREAALGRAGPAQSAVTKG